MRRQELSEFLHPREYVKNNIKFRINSCKNFINYKTAQAFILKEVLSCFENSEYSDTAKEILLFNFDVWFDYICEVEQVLLRNETPTNEVYQIIKNLAFERFNYMEKTFEINNNIFDKEFIDFYQKIDRPFINLFDGYLKKFFNEGRDVFFFELTSVIIKWLSHLLYKLHDIIIFLTENRLVLSIDEYDQFYISNQCSQCSLSSEDMCYFMNMIRTYIKWKKLENEKLNSIIIKNYLSDNQLANHLAEIVKKSFNVKEVEVK